MLTFCPVKPGEKTKIARLSALATRIVREHFDPLIGKKQNDYMLARFQTEEAIARQLESGFSYYFVCLDAREIGFLAFFPKDGKMDLSKFYLEKEFRGRGLARPMFDFVAEQTRRAGLPAIFLNVNRDNAQSIAVYRHLGFEKLREEKNDIGGGYYMDDFVLQYVL